MMSTLSFAALLVVAAVCCGASVVKRQAPGTIDICEVTSAEIGDGAALDLTSPNFGYGSYWNNANCLTSLQSGKEALLLQVTFEAQNLEQQSECSFDSLCLGGVKFCGSWAGKKSFSFLVPAYSSFSIRFITDYSVTESGLRVLIKARAARSDDEIFQADSGVGSAANRITYRQVSYSSEYLRSYQDRCAANNSQQSGWNNTWSSNTWEYYTSPSGNESNNNYTTPSYSANWNTSSSSSNSSWIYSTTRSNNGNWTTSYSNNGNWSTTRPNNGNWTTSSSNNGNWTTSSSNNGNWSTTRPNNGNWTTSSSNNGNWSTTRPNNGNWTTSSSNNGNWSTTRPNNGNWTTSSSNNGNWSTTRPNNGNWTTSSSNNGNWTTSSSNYTLTTNSGTWLSTTSRPNRNSTNTPITTRRPVARTG